jgi:hypothetical protein
MHPSQGAPPLLPPQPQPMKYCYNTETILPGLTINPALNRTFLASLDVCTLPPWGGPYIQSQETCVHNFLTWQMEQSAPFKEKQALRLVFARPSTQHGQWLHQHSKLKSDQNITKALPRKALLRSMQSKKQTILALDSRQQSMGRQKLHQTTYLPV